MILLIFDFGCGYGGWWVGVGRFGFQVRVELYIWAQFPLYTHKTQINAPVVHPPEEGLALEQQPRQHAADAPQIHGIAVVRVAQQELGGLFFGGCC